MKAIHSFLLFLGLFGAISALKADFFAYQLWVHPETDQHIHMFGDVHFSSGNTLAKQQADFSRAIKANNGLGLVEDLKSLKKILRPLSYHVDTIFNKTDRLFNIIFRKKIKEETPLSGLAEYCQQQGAPCINIEDRIDESDDNIELNIKNQIQRHKNSNHIFIATGFGHSYEISNWLIKLGFKRNRFIMHKKLYELFMTDNNLQIFFNFGFTEWTAKDKLEKLCESFDFTCLETAITQSIQYPLNIEALFQPEGPTNPMISIDPNTIRAQRILDEILTETMNEIMQPFQDEITKAKVTRATSVLKKASAIGATVGAAALLYKKKPKPAAITAAVGTGIHWAADKIASWWYGQ